MRGELPPAGFLAGAQVPKPHHPSIPPEVIAYRGRKRSESGKLFKLGRQDYLGALLRNGDIRIRAASSYNDPSLNYAVSADELHFTLNPNISDLRTIGSDGGESTVTLRNAVYEFAHPSDFYVYCMTARFWPRLFKD